jgi:hypothetical protein
VKAAVPSALASSRKSSLNYCSGLRRMRFKPGELNALIIQ